MADDSIRVTLRIPADYHTWLEREIQAKREKGFRSTVTDEILTCIAHRYLAKLTHGQRSNIVASIMKPQAKEEPREHQAELITADG
jgi:hypothetical protein